MQAHSGPKAPQDLTGKTFNRLTVLSLSHKDKRGKKYWNCVCTCENTKIVRHDCLTTNNTHSCGCLNRELNIGKCKARSTHGMSYSPEYHIWNQMIQRCTNKRSARYKDYGGRGITVCETWKKSFDAFYKDMGPRPSEDHSIERLNNSGNYCQSNCVWSTRDIQSRNKRNNCWITINGQTKILQDWARDVEISESTIAARLIYGYTDELLIVPFNLRTGQALKGNTCQKN